MGPLTLYARRAPAQGTFGKHDVDLYSDAGGKMLKARWPWWQSNVPTKRNKYVMFNCYRWRLEWLPD